MKRQAALLLLLAAALLSVGCNRQYITEETYIVQSPKTILDFDVPDSKWAVQDGYFEALLSVPDITDQVVKKGNVTVSMKLTGDNNAILWTPLPCVRAFMEQLEDDTDFYYSLYTDFEWGKGQVFVYVTSTDLFTGQRPGDRSFRVVVYE